jgi:hypothetical protein
MNKLLKFTGMIIMSGIFFSCSDMMDTHQKYLEGGEKIYAPKVDSLYLYNGKNRVMLRFWLLESPNVRSVDIFWNNYADSMTVPVSPSANLDSMNVYIPLNEEKAYTFYVRTTDIFGNRSLSEMASATSYGAIYESLLVNRGVKSAETTGSATEIQWYAAADDDACTEVRYTDVNGEVQTVRTSASESSTFCPDAKAGSTYERRSLYVPTNSIDTFYMEWNAIVPVGKFDKSSWSVIDWSDEQADDGGGAVVIINNSLDDFWHSQWQGDVPGLPHWAIIDMGAPKEITKINTYRRRNNTNTKSVWYYVGNEPDPNADSWTKIAEGTYSSGDLLSLQVSESVTGRYLKIYLPDSNGEPHTSIAEIDVFGYE